jgi:hypothetical protein
VECGVLTAIFGYVLCYLKSNPHSVSGFAYYLNTHCKKRNLPAQAVGIYIGAAKGQMSRY